MVHNDDIEGKENTITDSSFSQWFDLQVGDLKDTNWQSYLHQSSENNLELSVIGSDPRDNELLRLVNEVKILNGYLDFQTPAVLIDTRIKSLTPGIFGRQSKYTIGARALITQIHLENLNERCFMGFTLNSPALHAYIDPQLVGREIEQRPDGFIPKLDFLEPKLIEFFLSSGIKIKILSAMQLSTGIRDTSIEQSTSLRLMFPESVSFTDCQKIMDRVHFFFCFLTGRSLQLGKNTLHSNKRSVLGDEQSEYIDCKAIYKSSLLSYPTDFGNEFASLTDGRSTVSIENIFDHIVSDKDGALTYFMDMVLKAEVYERRLDDGFIELIGLLENFHKTYFGSGLDKERKDYNKEMKQKLKKLVAKSNDKEAIEFLNKLCMAQPGELSLFERLEELKKEWAEDGFRGGPDLRKIKSLRNVKPHGRGNRYSNDDIQYIAMVLPFLTGLSRYHILKYLGFDRESIAKSFHVIRLGLGSFVPIDLCE